MLGPHAKTDQASGCLVEHPQITQITQIKKYKEAETEDEATTQSYMTIRNNLDLLIP
jgi:hypothetical protein